MEIPLENVPCLLLVRLQGFYLLDVFISRDCLIFFTRSAKFLILFFKRVDFECHFKIKRGFDPALSPYHRHIDLHVRDLLN